MLDTDVAQIAMEQLKVKINDIKFFSDSRIVLGHINNTKKVSLYMWQTASLISTVSAVRPNGTIFAVK